VSIPCSIRHSTSAWPARRELIVHLSCEDARDYHDSTNEA